MSLRLPQNLSTSARFETGASALEAELQAERAVSLGRAGRAVERALAALQALPPDDPQTDAHLQDAADAVWRYFAQREACGMIDHDKVITDYAIPKAVLARVGAAPR